ncbi:hypothetical protein D3C71_1424400 [compost metagenome]
MDPIKQRHAITAWHGCCGPCALPVIGLQVAAQALIQRLQQLFAIQFAACVCQLQAFTAQCGVELRGRAGGGIGQLLQKAAVVVVGEQAVEIEQQSVECGHRRGSCEEVGSIGVAWDWRIPATSRRTRPRGALPRISTIH